MQESAEKHYPGGATLSSFDKGMGIQFHFDEGMILSDIIDLFAGSAVLALSYRQFVAWLTQDFAGERPQAVRADKTDRMHEQAYRQMPTL